MNKVDRKSEIYLHGLNAVLALFKHRPNDIIKLFFTDKTEKSVNEIKNYLQKTKKGFKKVSMEELEKISKATHHEGVVALAKRKMPIDLKVYLSEKNLKKSMVVLEGVSNPHNIGAIMRSMAHFGIDILACHDSVQALSPAAIRSSEGGAEAIDVVYFQDIKQLINELKKQQFQIITTSSHAKKSLYELKFSNKVAIVFGEENSGLTKNAMSEGELIKIPGTDLVESLNVSVATSVILGEYYRQSNS